MRTLWLPLFVIPSCLVSAHAHAVCATSGSGYGAWWYERSGASCDCVFKATTYACLASGSGHDVLSTVTLDTLAGDCARDCTDLTGFEAKVSAIVAAYASGTYGTCDTFVDLDGDRVGACLDQSDRDPRIGVKQTGSEALCDGVDNDSDGTVDDGFAAACERDHKREGVLSAYQGDGSSMVHLIEGSLRRVEPELSVAGPYGPLSFEP